MPVSSGEVNKPKHAQHAHPHETAPVTPVTTTNIPVQMASVPSPVGRPHYRRRRASFFLIAFAIILFAIIGVVVFVSVYPWPYNIMLNGHEVSITKNTTTDDLFDISGFKPKPGNLLAIDGELLQNGKGEAFAIEVNGEKVNPEGHVYAQNDTVVLTNGDDVTEEVTEEYIDLPNTIATSGIGAIHRLTTPETAGSMLRRTGVISGKVQEEVVNPPSVVQLDRFNIDTNGKKVIALTFDDGPWHGSTNQVLDVLEANGAKATFFTIGQQIEGNEDAILRAHQGGNQVCTHTWDHASGSGQGVNLDYMTPEEQLNEIRMGMEAISNVTGEDASVVIRVPGGNFSDNTALLASTLATHEIGWNIDTHDWRRPGVEAIETTLLAAQPGNIILMHDGGGDRSQTIQALANALPVLKEQGFEFVTIDELLQYAA